MNHKSYHIEKFISDGLIGVFSWRYGNQLWVLSDKPIRKNHECQLCGKTILKGKERMFRPITNLGNRMDRFCIKCIDDKRKAKESSE